MDHRSSINKLGRNSAHRKALLKAQAKALFRYERIRTTVAKAKEARKLAEKLITRAPFCVDRNAPLDHSAFVTHIL